MKFGFPADEVRPISCEPYGAQYTHPDSYDNDAMGNVSLTVLDNLDTLIMLEEWDQLETILAYLEANQKDFFHQDHVVQVFEATIRWLGGLLLAHLAITDVDWCLGDARMCTISQNYSGFLLSMAYDLGVRLIPAFKTSSHLPLPRINLARGLAAVPKDRNRESCTAGATTPLVEFTLLLRLTGDAIFEKQTNKTFWKLWNARLELGLVPMSLDPISSKWLDVITGVGALVDSFYEYAVKGAIIFNNDDLWSVFSRLYQALLAHLAYTAGDLGGTFFSNIHTSAATRVTNWIDLLSAFWPGLQVLAGRLSDAVSTHLIYLKVWDQFDSLPERWETQTVSIGATHQQKVDLAVSLEWYPLRPEFIESTYYLYRATRDPMYLQIGVRILTLFETKFKAVCGFAGYQDTRVGLIQNRMETFVLGELLKYLFLLFDEANESYVHSKAMNGKNWVFSTEAHPLWYTDKLGKASVELFSPHKRKIRIATTRFSEPGRFRSMWRDFVESHNDLQSPALLSGQDCSAQNRFGPNLSPAASRFDVCETMPIQWTKQEFLSSGYYNWSEIFLPEYYMELTLVRPEHLAEEDENHVIELTDHFLNTYSWNSKLTCARVPTTIETDFVFGNMARPENFEMYDVRLEDDEFPFAKDDLVMPVISGRVRTELMKAGNIDVFNRNVTHEYVSRHARASSGGDPKILRIKHLNGLKVSAGQNVWTESARLQQSDLFRITDEGQVYILGNYVENLRVY